MRWLRDLHGITDHVISVIRSINDKKSIVASIADPSRRPHRHTLQLQITSFGSRCRRRRRRATIRLYWRAILTKLYIYRRRTIVCAHIRFTGETCARNDHNLLCMAARYCVHRASLLNPKQQTLKQSWFLGAVEIIKFFVFAFSFAVCVCVCVCFARAMELKHHFCHKKMKIVFKKCAKSHYDDDECDENRRLKKNKTK